MNKKELINQYKSRVQIGGVYAIKNMKLDKWLVDAVADLVSAKNRFEFMGDSYGKIAADYKKQKGEGFIFKVLEELKKTEIQTDKEFKADLDVLKEIWLERLDGQALY